MKPTIIALVVVIVMGVLAVNRDALFQALEDASTYETAVVKEEVIKEVEPECLPCQDAYDAKKRQLELEAELESLEANFAATTATYEAERAEYVERKTQLEKDLGSY